jgi:hypothetical protein
MGPSQTVEATGPDGALATLDGSGSSDPDGERFTITWSWPAGAATGARPKVHLPIGTTTVTLVVSDPHDATATDTVQITVRDMTMPAVAIISPASP